MVLNSFMEEMDKHGEAPEDFNLYALDGGEALTNMAPWKNMVTSHIDPVVAAAWSEQGHVRLIDARMHPERLDDLAALHATDTRPLVIDTERPSDEVESAIYPTEGTRYYLREIATAPPAWLMGSVIAFGHATSPALLYLLLNLLGVGTLLWVTARLQAQPRRQRIARISLAAFFLLGLLFIGNGFYAFRANTTEDFMLYFFKVRLTALAMMGLCLWILSRKLGHLLSRPARLLLLIPIIWGVSKLTFVVMPPHAYATYPWLLSVTLFGGIAAMSPTILSVRQRRWWPLAADDAAVSGS